MTKQVDLKIIKVLSYVTTVCFFIVLLISIFEEFSEILYPIMLFSVFSCTALTGGIYAVLLNKR